MIDNIIDNSSIQALCALLEKSRNCLILTHSRPDGDAIGSSLALAHFIKSTGREATIVVPNDYPPFLAWMPGIESIIINDKQQTAAEEAIQKADLIFCLDFNALSRIDEVGEKVSTSTAPKILIDHHLFPDDIFDVTISYPEACSTAELVFRTIWQMGRADALTKEAAECIYTGIMTDTGNFAYASSRKDIYHIVAELISKGIDKDIIYRRVFYNYSFSRMRLMGYMMYEKLKYYPERNAALLTLTYDELKRFNGAKGDTEGIVNMPLQIKGTRFSCFLREESKGKINVSLRSVDEFPCNEVAAKFFNGGGHKNASGGEVRGTMEEAEQLFLKALEEFSDKLTD